MDHLDAKATVRDIQRRLAGFELDPFAAWVSQVFLDVVLADRFGAAGGRIGSVVQVCDSLEEEAVGSRFDLVVGNPPYGRVKLAPHLRGKFARSLFGHANLYGLFTDLAREGGVIAADGGFEGSQVAFVTAYSDRDDSAFKRPVSALAAAAVRVDGLNPLRIGGSREPRWRRAAEMCPVTRNRCTTYCFARRLTRDGHGTLVADDEDWTREAGWGGGARRWACRGARSRGAAMSRVGMILLLAGCASSFRLDA